ncbi:rCG36562 [Rattus norvegicus]|uniref:RCG36562 n=1 Tax=Rattus norvegicus TaxID=10116 RepID=A6JRZ8_RAT|nr:rCG36562 [Rattus norvegicus]
MLIVFSRFRMSKKQLPGFLF